MKVINFAEQNTVINQYMSELRDKSCAAIDPGMNANKYIVPGFGDAGDLCYGEKL